MDKENIHPTEEEEKFHISLVVAGHVDAGA